MSYVFAFYFIILRRDTRRGFLCTFYNAICNICKFSPESSDPAYLFEQLNLNYEKLCQDRPNNNYRSILDLLETIIYCYDSYSDYYFHKVFGRFKDQEVRNFILRICTYIKNINPFISISRKEADLMQSIKDALENNNKPLGVNSLNQLSQEIATKDKLITKKDKENQRANIVSIISIILTIFFGLLSVLPVFD